MPAAHTAVGGLHGGPARLQDEPVAVKPADFGQDGRVVDQLLQGRLGFVAPAELAEAALALRVHPL